MGVYIGPAPKTLVDRLMELRIEHRNTTGSWVSGYDAWVEVLKSAYAGQYLISPIAEPTTLFGMAIRVDDRLPPGTIELRNSQNETLGRIENVGARPSSLPVRAQHEPRRTVEYDEIAYEGNLQRIIVRKPRAATGTTTRLPTKCRRCHDTLPAGATFCIECGEKV